MPISLPQFPPLRSPLTSGGRRQAHARRPGISRQRSYGGPGCWQKALLRQRGLAPQRHPERPPPWAQNTHPPQARRSARPGPLGTQARHSEERAGGHRLVGLPPTLRRPRVATAPASPSRDARAGTRMRVRCPYSPARWVSVNSWSLPARRPYHPASLAAGASAGSQGALSPSSQRASTGQGPGWRGQARPGPRPLVPGWGTQLVKGRQPGAPRGRTLPPVVRRQHGCPPKRVRRRNSHGAYKPRSAKTIPVQPGGQAHPGHGAGTPALAHTDGQSHTALAPGRGREGPGQWRAVPPPAH